MSIALPTYPSLSDAVPSYLDWGGTLSPIFGGATQKLLRIGDRFALDVTMPPMEVESVGREWIATMILAQRTGAILKWPQMGFDVGVPGAPMVDGAGQSGATILLRGFLPDYTVQFGQFFSIIHGGRRYVHMAAANVTADQDGRMPLPIAPLLRMQPGNGEICEFDPPMIEGLLAGDKRDWTLTVALTVGIGFQIVEMK